MAVTTLDAPTGATHTELAELERLLVLTEVANQVDGFHSLGETITRLCHIVLDVMACDYACVRLPDTDESLLEIAGSSDPERIPGFERLDLRSNEITGPLAGHRPPSVEAYLLGKMQVIPSLDNATGDDAWKQRTRELGVRAMLALPLVRRGAVRGVLNCYWTHEFAPTDAQLLTLEVVGRLVALAVESARRADEARRRETALASARDRSASLIDLDEQLLTAQTQLAGLCGRQPGAALAGVANLLADHLRRSVALYDAGGTLIAVDGPPDQAARLVEDRAHSAELSQAPQDAIATFAVDGQRGPLGEIRVLPAVEPDDALAGRLLSFAINLLPIVLERREEYASVSRAARPFALLALCDGLLSGPQVSAAADVLGMGDNEPAELAVVRFATAEAAQRFAAQNLARVSGWSDAVAAAATGRDALVLLDGSPGRPERPPLDPGRHLGLVAVGLSRRFAGVAQLPHHLKEARYAVSAAPPGGITRHADLGPVADLGVHIPARELEAVVERYLGALVAYDEQHQTQLLGTLRRFLALNGSVEAVASDLHIHRNTVHQRLRKISELCALDVRALDNLAQLSLVLKWHDYRKGDR